MRLKPKNFAMYEQMIDQLIFLITRECRECLAKTGDVAARSNALRLACEVERRGEGGFGELFPLLYLCIVLLIRWFSQVFF